MTLALFVATRKGLFRIARRGKTWKWRDVAFAGSPVSCVMQDPRDGAIYAALDHGHFGTKLHRSDDGENWTEVAVPVYPKPPTKKVPVDAIGRAVPWKLRLIWSLAVDPSRDGAMWCGTCPGGLFHSTDRGASWRLVRSLWDRPERAEWAGGGFDSPGIHSIVVDPRDPRRVTVGVSVGGVWRTDDHGAKWRLAAKGMRAEYTPPDQAYDEAQQDPHRIVQCAAAPDRLWCQHHNGIFTTKRDGTWREVSKQARPSAFGFGVAVHPEDPDRAWFVPAQKDECRIPRDAEFVVSRTRDGGRSFEVLRSGLPKGPAYDLVFRHALAIDPRGGTLAFGSTTGGLWVGDGTRFTALSAHLPPVYAVAFGEE